MSERQPFLTIQTWWGCFLWAMLFNAIQEGVKAIAAHVRWLP